jgi:hypothetical protein
MDPKRAPKRKRSTRTSAFGTHGRIRYDAARLYNSRLSPTLS